MRAIQSYLPKPRHTEVHRIFVTADPATAWQTARHFDGASIPWVRMLFDLRDLPNVIRGKMPVTNDRRLGVDQVAESGKGFMILEEKPGKEVVVGAVGKFWHLDIPFAQVTSDQFTTFEEPGWGKLAWAITVEPYLSGSTIRFELRTTATDELSWKKLNRYYQLIAVGSYPIRSSFMSHLQMQLGKMKFPEDEAADFPGNDLIPDAKYQLTYHKNIEAPPSIVWQYLMQLGCDRAGWYSVDFLDNGGKPSIDHLVKGWEPRAVGDQLAATPAKNSFYDVYAVEKEKHFIIGGETDRLGGPFKMTWAFILLPMGEDATHLISNARMVSSPKWAEWFMGSILYPPIHQLMSEVQLRNLKNMAERDAQLRLAFNEEPVFTV